MILSTFVYFEFLRALLICGKVANVVNVRCAMIGCPIVTNQLGVRYKIYHKSAIVHQFK
jgi:hypothetical protein